MRASGIVALVSAGLLFAGFQSATGNGAGTEGGAQGRVRFLVSGESDCVTVFPEGAGIAPVPCKDPAGAPVAGAVLASDVTSTGDLGARGYGPVLTRDQVRDLWLRHGGAPSEAATAVAVATAESGRRPAASNTTNGDGSADFGLWQVNTIHKRSFVQVTGRPWAEVTDPDVNTAYAVHLQREQGWRPWVAWWSGAYSRYLA